MKKLLFAMSAVVLALSASATCLKSGESIAWLGDSITWLGAFPNRPGYVNLCHAAFKEMGLEVKMLAHGVSGHKSNQMLARLPGILAAKPTYMTLSCGVNDVWHQDSNRGILLPQYKENVIKIIDQCKAAGVKVILFTATMITENIDDPKNQRLIPYNDFLRTIAKEKGCTLVDMNAEMQKRVANFRARTGLKANFLTYDGVHMDFLGDVMMARMVLKHGFGFTDDEMKKANDAIGKARAHVTVGWGSQAVYIGGASIPGALYLQAAEAAIANKRTPPGYIHQMFGGTLSDMAGELFNEVAK